MEILTQSIIEEFSNESTTRHLICKPPKEAYYFFPKGTDVIEWDKENPKKTMRRVFEGAIRFNEFEEAILIEFTVELEKYKIKNDKNVKFPEKWDDSKTLRYIQGSNYNINKAIENLINHFEWRENIFPIKISDKIIEILNLGFIYGHGRDSNFRPIFVINASIFNIYIKHYTVDEWINSFVYFLEYLINNLLIPGQVENWLIILDVANFSMLFIPQELKTIFNVLMNNYKCRMFVMYIVNVSTVLNFLWSTFIRVLDTNTEKKIRLLKKSDMKQIFNYINPEQIEEKFGGKAQNVKSHYFPHWIPSNKFLLENDSVDKIIDGDKYIELLKNNKKYIHSPYLDQEYLNKVDNLIDEDCKIYR